MSIPGFTADASLHGMDRYNQRVRISATSRAEVVPAISCDLCIYCFAHPEIKGCYYVSRFCRNNHHPCDQP